MGQIHPVLWTQHKPKKLICWIFSFWNRVVTKRFLLIFFWTCELLSFFIRELNKGADRSGNMIYDTQEESVSTPEQNTIHKNPLARLSLSLAPNLLRIYWQEITNGLELNRSQHQPKSQPIILFTKGSKSHKVDSDHGPH